MFKFTWVRIIIYLLPAIIASYLEGHLRFHVFSSEVQEKKLDGYLFFAVLIITTVIFPYEYEVQKRKLNYHLKMSTKIFRTFREKLNKSLSDYFNKDDLYLNVRIF